MTFRVTILDSFRWASRQRALWVLTALFLAQLGLSLGITRQEQLPPTAKLEQWPEQIGSWRSYQEGVLDPEMQRILHPDDYLLRQYVQPDRSASALLFIAYFKSQRAGNYPHSPRNCLPGNGWSPYESNVISLNVGNGLPNIPVNRYLVARDDERSEVLYWYQTWNRVVANELYARMYLLGDSMRYNRTDTALVRIITPFSRTSAPKADLSTEFARSVFHLVRGYIPQQSAGTR